ncbi:MAG: hypothetical protein HYX63_17720 [Gammaproteobacteria bacterium]|nr:hypothetical protein [Gammaproteobacteria bacterium]
MRNEKSLWVGIVGLAAVGALMMFASANKAVRESRHRSMSSLPNAGTSWVVGTVDQEGEAIPAEQGTADNDKDQRTNQDAGDPD